MSAANAEPCFVQCLAYGVGYGLVSFAVAQGLQFIQLEQRIHRGQGAQ
ncbi:MAG: hypothetical protein R2873_27785 [Caldilineaceae bacterium]